MYRLANIRVEGHRRLLDASIDIHPLTVLIGANGSGKTSLLEVLSMLSQGARNQLGHAITERGGLNEILTRNRASSWKVQVTVEDQDQNNRLWDSAQLNRLIYSLELKPTASYGYFISDETFHALHVRPEDSGEVIVGSPGLVKLTTAVDEFDLGSNQELSLARGAQSIPDKLGKAYFPILAKPITSLQFLRPIDVGQRSPIRLPQQLTPAENPGVDAEQLLSSLYSLRESDVGRYELILDSLRAAFPDFERLEFPPVAAGMVALVWKDRQYSKPFYANQLSEGTLRFLWLATVLAMAKPNELILIDEPETSLHPRQLSLLAELMREAALRCNLIVATHADRLIRALKPEEVQVVDVEDGESRFTWGDSLDIEHWLQDYTLEQLWQMGVLGRKFMRIAILVEGDTEATVLPTLIREVILPRLPAGQPMPSLKFISQDGLIRKGSRLRDQVANHLRGTRNPFHAVIALTDVYTGPQSTDFIDGEDAKRKMREWVGNEQRFHPHVAQYEFEAWLLPFWGELQERAGHNQVAPRGAPEKVNHGNPPSARIRDLYRRGNKGRDYVKPREAAAILRGKDLAEVAKVCPELRAFLNTILMLSGVPETSRLS